MAGEAAPPIVLGPVREAAHEQGDDVVEVPLVDRAAPQLNGTLTWPRARGAWRPRSGRRRAGLGHSGREKLQRLPFTRRANRPPRAPVSQTVDDGTQRLAGAAGRVGRRPGAQRCAVRDSGERPGDGVRHRGDVSDRHQRPVPATVQDLGRAVGTVRGDDRGTAAQGLDDDIAEALEPRGRNGKRGPPEHREGVEHEAHEQHPVRHAEVGGHPLQSRLLGAGAVDFETRRPATGQGGEGPDQGAEILFRGKPAHRDHQSGFAVPVETRRVGRALVENRVRRHLDQLRRGNPEVVGEVARGAVRQGHDRVRRAISEPQEAVGGARLDVRVGPHADRCAAHLAQHDERSVTSRQRPRRHEGDQVRRRLRADHHVGGEGDEGATQAGQGRSELPARRGHHRYRTMDQRPQRAVRLKCQDRHRTALGGERVGEQDHVPLRATPVERAHEEGDPPAGAGWRARPCCRALLVSRVEGGSHGLLVSQSLVEWRGLM